MFYAVYTSLALNFMVFYSISATDNANAFSKTTTVSFQMQSDVRVKHFHLIHYHPRITCNSTEVIVIETAEMDYSVRPRGFGHYLD